MADQIKISELLAGGILQQSDLLVVARKHETDDRYDYSRSIKLDDLATYLATTDVFNQAVYNTTAQNISFIASNSELPIGCVLPYAGSEAPNGYLICDGSELDITGYPDLAEFLSSNPFGSGATGTPKLPDLRGTTIAGVGDSPTFGALLSQGNTLGKAGGDKDITLGTDHIPSHNHTFSVRVALEDTAGGNQGRTLFDPANPMWDNPNPSKIDLSGTSSDVGGGQSHSNVQPTLLLNFIIKASQILPDSETEEDKTAPVSPFTKQYTSTALTIDRDYEVAHNLGGTPSLVQVSLRCATENYGYKIGDQIVAGTDNDGDGIFTIWKSETAIGINSLETASFQAANRLADKSAGEVVDLNLDNWRIVVNAWL